MKTVKDLAEALSVSDDLVESWLGLFGEFASSTEVDGVTVYPDRAVEVLRTVQQLDNDGKNYHEIRAELSAQFSFLPTDAQAPAPPPTKPPAPAPKPPPAAPATKAPEPAPKAPPPKAKAPKPPAPKPPAPVPEVPKIMETPLTTPPAPAPKPAAPKPAAPEPAAPGPASASAAGGVAVPDIMGTGLDETPASSAAPAAPAPKPAPAPTPAPKAPEPAPSASLPSMDDLLKGMDSQPSPSAAPSPSPAPSPAPASEKPEKAAKPEEEEGELGDRLEAGAPTLVDIPTMDVSLEKREDKPMSVLDPKVADAFRGIITWMEVAEEERKRTRRSLALLKILASTLLLLFIGLFGAVAFLMKMGKDEATEDKRSREAATKMRGQIAASVADFRNDVGRLASKVESVSAASAGAAAAIKEQAEKLEKRGTKLDATLDGLRLQTEEDSARITDMLDEWKQQMEILEPALTKAAAAPAVVIGRPAAGTVAAGAAQPAAQGASAAEQAEAAAQAARAAAKKAPSTVYGPSAEQIKKLFIGVRKVYEDDNRYIGDYDADGKKDGWGTYLFDSGDTYVGEFKNDRKHGQGTYTFKNGDTYIGQYKDDLRAGNGKYIYVSGDSYLGDFVAGKREGHGVYTYADGGQYVGQWKGGLKHGKGYWVDAQGRRVDGIWENDKFARLADAAAGQPGPAPVVPEESPAPEESPVAAPPAQPAGQPSAEPDEAAPPPGE